MCLSNHTKKDTFNHTKKYILITRTCITFATYGTSYLIAFLFILLLFVVLSLGFSFTAIIDSLFTLFFTHLLFLQYVFIIIAFFCIFNMNIYILSGIFIIWFLFYFRPEDDQIEIYRRYQLVAKPQCFFQLT